MTQKFRAQGDLNPDIPSEYKRQTDAWPARAEIIQRGVIGAYNGAQANSGDLATDIALVSGDQATKDWLGAGVDPQEIKTWWAAHWQPVSIGDAFELYRRTAAGLLTDGPPFLDADLDLAIAQTGVLPGYRENIKALAFTPLNRRQIKQLYDDYIIDEGQLNAYLVAGGLEPNDAPLQVQDWQKLRPVYTRKRVGGTGPSGLMGEYASCSIGTSEYLSELNELGFNGAEQSLALAEAQAVRKRKGNAQLMSFAKGRYTSGTITYAQCSAAL